jgi:hypothetical protein
MGIAARLSIGADRYTACVRTIRLVGIDATNANPRMQVRLIEDTPGLALVDLQQQQVKTAEGLFIESVVIENGVPVTTLLVRINKTTMKGLPYAGELGSATTLAYDLIGTFGGDERRLIYGNLVILPGVTGAEGAPTDRPAGYGNASADAATWSAAELVFASDIVQVSIDGFSFIGPLIDRATAAAAAVDAYRAGGTYVLGDVAGTPNVITASAAVLPGLVPGLKILFRAVADNTGGVTLNVNGLGPIPVAQADGGSALKARDFRAGYPYLVMYSAAGGNWQVVSYGHLRDDLRQAFPDYAEVSGTANAIVLTAPLGQQPVRGFSIPFTTGPAANTGPVTIALNGGGARPLLKGGNDQLEAGDLPPFTKTRIAWDGFGGAIWSLESVGLPARVDPAGVTPTSIATFRAVEAMRDANPHGVSTYVRGLRTTTATVLPVVGLGTSVGRGADLTPLNYPDREVFNFDHSPMRYLVDGITGVLGHGVYSVPFDNRSVNASFDDSFGAQLAASGFAPKLLVPIIAGMNTGSMYGVHGIGADVAIASLRQTLRTIRAQGGIAFLGNTICPWPEKIVPADQAAALGMGINWPADQRTLAFFGVWSFDKAANTLSCAPDGNAPEGIFASGKFGGTKIKPGSLLYVHADGAPGANAGLILTVAEVVNATTARIAAGQIAQTLATTTALIRHTQPPLEEIMTVPPSKQRQTKDWTGHGIPVEGLASFSLYNNMLDVLAREEDVPLLDFAYRGFRFVELYGWRAVYEMTYEGVTQSNVNHPVYPAQKVIYGQPLAAIGADFARGTMRPGYHVIRGPEIG